MSIFQANRHNTVATGLLAVAALLAVLLPISGCSSNPPELALSEPLPEPPVDRRSDGSLKIERLWSANVSGSGDAQTGFELGVDGDRVCTAGQNGKVRCLDPIDGKLLWIRDLKVELSAGAGLGAGMVLVGTANGEVIALKTLMVHSCGRPRLVAKC